MPIKILLLMAAASLYAAPADNVLTPAEKQAGFRLLFDGHSFHGWHDPATENPPGESWVVENGCLKTAAKPRIKEDLITQESFGDFELKFDWRISVRGNTGVKYRLQRVIFTDSSKVDKSKGFEAMLEREVTTPQSDRAKLAPGATGEAYTVAYEFQLIDDSGYPGLNGREPGVHSTGALYAMIPPRTMAAHPAGEWNTSRLFVKGQHFEHWINDVKVLDGSLSSEEARAGTAKRWANAPSIREMLNHAKPSGPITLQHHDAEVWFKNIKIRRL